MDHQTALIETIAIGLGAAFIGGLLARRVRLPTIVGYLLAGVAIGPFTPGLVADSGTATELAELGVILLMFGVGIHFSIADLLASAQSPSPGRSGRSPSPPSSASGSASCWAGASSVASCSGSPCRWHPPSSCFARSAHVASSTRRRGASRSAGSS